MRALLVGVAFLAGTVRAADPVLLFPTGDAPARLRLAVTDAGKPPDADWSAGVIFFINPGKLSPMAMSRKISLKCRTTV